MRGNQNKKLWLLWFLATLIVGTVLLSFMYIGGGRKLMLMGETTNAHHQIELACETCHVSGFFADPKKAEKAMNKACLTCHKDELNLSNDSHPVKKFRDPRNADRLEKLNAQSCITCHAEHIPEETRASAVTIPMDYCVACHEDIGKERPSHQGAGFETCASAGCHNYHDNTALYEDFLVKHAGVPAFKEQAILKLAAITRALPAQHPSIDNDNAVKIAGMEASRYLASIEAVAPEKYKTQEAVDAWKISGHAAAGLNCATCHAPKQKDSTDVELLAANWVEAPERKVCATCHKQQNATFVEGKHGMRFHPKVAKPRKAPEGNDFITYLGALFADESYTPMPVTEARLPMKDNPPHGEIGSCNTCHTPHSVDIRFAAVEACATCHDDDHTKAYFTSPHYGLWQAEMAGDLPAGSGVGCADCHMPKIEERWGDNFFTTHNQNAYLRPNEKMIRPVCLQCHSLEFAIDALADPVLVQNNFTGRPTVHIESIDWATKRIEKEK